MELLESCDLEKRIEEFLIFSSLYDPQNQMLLDEAEEMGFAAWEEEFKRRFAYMQEHRNEVMLKLALFRKEWPMACEALEEVFEMMDSGEM